MNEQHDAPKPGCCGESPRVGRRRFLAGSGAALAALSTRSIFAGPFAGPFACSQVADGFPIPADKRLDAAWVESLFARGEPEVVRGADLGFIGMPVGGLFAGTVYLSGDGRLWNWDVFNVHHEGAIAHAGVTYRDQPLRERDGANYVDPPEPKSPFAFGCQLTVGDDSRPLDQSGWRDVNFRGEYPIGTVDFSDPGADVDVRLEAFSPFVPLDVEASSFPATVLAYTVTNTSASPLVAELTAAFSNPVLLNTRREAGAAGLIIESRSETLGATSRVVCSAHAAITEPDPARPDIVFEDFESGTYERWTATGTAFGTAPRRVDNIADYQGELGASGEWLVNSHETRGGEDVVAADRHTGRLTSVDFPIARRFVHFLIGGGAHAGRTCLNLVVDGEVVRSATGHDSNAMRRATFDVAELEGRAARLEVVDAEAGAWGNIGVDAIEFSDQARPIEDLDRAPDQGSFCVACTGPDSLAEVGADETARVGRKLALAAGESAVVTFVVAWYFPNARVPGFAGRRRWYASRWESAGGVAADLEARLSELKRQTFNWRETYYDSSLPYWLLDRSMIPVDALATSTCYRFEDGRYWFWEGVGCCAGTCTHVWGYAQAIGRLFPEVERRLREEVDFGLAFHADTGAIDYRAEVGRRVATDGQCGCILRAYREHQMSPDGAFLERLWPRIKRSIEYLLAEDMDHDGLLEGAQYNTLDAAWYGPMGWLSSLFLAAVAAGGEMAAAVGDTVFEARCGALLARGRRSLVDELFDGEYFVHRPDPAHPEANSTGRGCHIDQVYGQAWAHQVGVPRVVPEAECRLALRSLYKYNFAPDVGVYRDWMKTIAGGRWYAVPGEGGLLMCTFPKGGAERATGEGQSAWAAMYMNECMTGFEYQVAAHMLWEGLVLEGLAITRAVHDRYAPARRNPYNEIECSDHYGRALSAFGVFLGACGWEYDGPRARLAFAPRIRPDDFQAAFTAAEGWGSIGQRRKDGELRLWVALRHGQLALAELGFDEPERAAALAVTASVRNADGAERALAAPTVTSEGTRRQVRFAERLELRAGDRLELTAR